MRLARQYWDSQAFHRSGCLSFSKAREQVWAHTSHRSKPRPLHCVHGCSSDFSHFRDSRLRLHRESVLDESLEPTFAVSDNGSRLTGRERNGIWGQRLPLETPECAQFDSGCYLDWAWSVGSAILCCHGALRLCHRNVLVSLQGHKTA